MSSANRLKVPIQCQDNPYGFNREVVYDDILNMTGQEHVFNPGAIPAENVNGAQASSQMLQGVTVIHIHFHMDSQKKRAKGKGMNAGH